MTASLPQAVQSVFDRFIATELTTIDRLGQPLTLQPGLACRTAFELPSTRLTALRVNAAKARRFPCTAKRELARRR